MVWSKIGHNLDVGKIYGGFTNLWEGLLWKYAALPPWRTCRSRSLWHTWSDSPLFLPPSFSAPFLLVSKNARSSRRYGKDSGIGAAKNGACWPLYRHVCLLQSLPHKPNTYYGCYSAWCAAYNPTWCYSQCLFKQCLLYLGWISLLFLLLSRRRRLRPDSRRASFHILAQLPLSRSVPFGFAFFDNRPKQASCRHIMNEWTSGAEVIAASTKNFSRWSDW